MSSELELLKSENEQLRKEVKDILERSHAKHYEWEEYVKKLTELQATNKNKIQNEIIILKKRLAIYEITPEPEDTGLTCRWDLRCNKAVRTHPGKTQSELAAILETKTGKIHHCLVQLKGTGYIKKEEDGRYYPLFLKPRPTHEEEKNKDVGKK